MITTSRTLDDTDKKIIKLLGDDLTAKEIGYQLNLTQFSVQARIREMKKYYKVKKTAALISKVK